MKYILFLCFATRYFESETSSNKRWGIGRYELTLDTIIFLVTANVYVMLFFDPILHQENKKLMGLISVLYSIIAGSLLRLYLSRKGLIKKYYREFYSFEHRIKAQYTIGAFALIIVLALNLGFGKIIFDILMKAYFS